MQLKGRNTKRFIVTRVSSLANFLFALVLIGSAGRSAFAFQAQFGVGPDNNQEVLISALNSAKKTILLNAYEFDHPIVAQILKDKIASGVSVQILLEGEPVGRMGMGSRETLDELKGAMARASKSANHVFIMMRPKKGDPRRFRFDHAKYAVIDSRRAFISSENLSMTGHANPGTIGNRGWDTILDSPTIAAELTQTFQNDIDPSFGDIAEYSTDMNLPTHPGGKAAATAKRAMTPYAAASGQVQEATLIYSPHSMEGLTQLVRNAKSSVQVEEMSLPLLWRNDPVQLNPLVSELIEAARRKVKVQVLLNDDRVFERSFESSHDSANISLNESFNSTSAVSDFLQTIGITLPLLLPGEPESSTLGRSDSIRKNAKTVDYLRSLGICERIPLEAKIVDTRALKITYIHNKGMIIDRTGALVSSVNGTSNSANNNREVAVYLKSPDAAAYFGEVYDFDWKSSSNDIPNVPQNAEVDCGSKLYLPELASPLAGESADRFLQLSDSGSA